MSYRKEESGKNVCFSPIEYETNKIFWSVQDFDLNPTSANKHTDTHTHTHRHTHTSTPISPFNFDNTAWCSGLSFELFVLFLAPTIVPETKEVVIHKYKTPMVSIHCYAEGVSMLEQGMYSRCSSEGRENAMAGHVGVPQNLSVSLWNAWKTPLKRYALVNLF